MNRLSLFALITNLVIITICPGAAQGLSAEEANRLLGRGVNLGNWLDAPRDQDWGVEIHATDFDQIKGAGFDSIRMPARISDYTSTQPPYQIEEDFLRILDSAIGHALARGLPIILDLHHYEEMMEDPEGQTDRFLAIWRQLAQRYQHYDEQLFFELLNEPTKNLHSPKWNALIKEVVPVIRESNPTRTLLIGPTGWNAADRLKELELPNDEHIIVTVHFYAPFEFTHQGASWVGDQSQAWLGTKWSGTPEERAELDSILNGAAQWAEENGRPINFGEFGSYSTADMESRVRWTNYVTREMEKRGFSWHYWEYSAGFGVFDAGAGTWREPLLNALMGKK